MSEEQCDLVYFDHNYLMSPYGENGILFTTEYARLIEISKKEPLLLRSLYKRAINESLRIKNTPAEIVTGKQNSILPIRRH